MSDSVNFNPDAKMVYGIAQPGKGKKIIKNKEDDSIFAGGNAVYGIALPEKNKKQNNSIFDEAKMVYGIAQPDDTNDQ